MALANSHALITSIMSHLMEAEYRRLQEWLNRLVKQNQECLRIVEPVGFLHEGQYYRPDWQGQGAFKKHALHASLWPEMADYLKDKKFIDTDAQMIRQTLFSLIIDCDCDQDIRDALPECITSKFELYRQMDRMREDGWTLQSKPKKLAGYRAMLPKIKMYSLSVLFF